MPVPVGSLAPSEILRLAPARIDELLDRLEREVPVRPPIVELGEGTADEAVVFGDTHGDWRSTLEVVRRFRDGDRWLIGLGDYIDRAPEDCGAGSVANALYLLQLAAELPDRVYLVQGNHEAVRRIPVHPHDLPKEVATHWGPGLVRYDRIIGLLERGPFAIATAAGAYLAHAGFPRGDLPSPWTEAFQGMDASRLAEIVWAECDASRLRRGAARPWGAADLDRFLAVTHGSIVLRGHDPDLAGRIVCDGRCLTLNTTRVYERYGGVLVARLPLRRTVRSVADLVVEHLPTEGATFPTPS